ncbi:MAG: helix-turn-helix domain-containing protein [Aeromicrobium sp.]
MEDLADHLGVPVTTIYDWRVDGKGPCGVRVGRHVKFTVSDVLAWVAAQTESRLGTSPTGGDLRWDADDLGPPSAIACDDPFALPGRTPSPSPSRACAICYANHFFWRPLFGG